mgnify:CR=1 FL=1
MTYFLFALRIAAFVVCATIAFTSDVAFVAAIWGCSSGIWFMLSLKSLFEDILTPNDDLINERTNPLQRVKQQELVDEDKINELLKRPSYGKVRK